MDLKQECLEIFPWNMNLIWFILSEMACFLQCLGLEIPKYLDIEFKITNHINITKRSLKALPFWRKQVRMDGPF